MHFNAFKLLVYIRVITRARQRATSLQYTGFVSRAKNLPYLDIVDYINYNYSHKYMYKIYIYIYII